jgi:hypothetical protein
MVWILRGRVGREIADYSVMMFVRANADIEEREGIRNKF